MINPMLAMPGNETTARRGIQIGTLVGTHAFDLKLDGVRAVLYYENSNATLTNRNGVDITHRYPDITMHVEFTLGRLEHPLILDGEVIAEDGSFESIAIRDKQTAPVDVAASMRRIPARYVSFDVLSFNGNDTTLQPWSTRRALLDAFHEKFTPSGKHTGTLSTTLWSMQAEMLDHVHTLGLEGVIAKRLTSRYQPGSRSRDWIKFKTTRRVSCVPVGYEPGQGARAHFGAMYLAMIGPDGPVQVGRVGTGFNTGEIIDLKRRLDEGQLFVVEIECLNRTKTGQLRFPVYKGIRSDLSVADATLSQLEQLPAC